MAPASCEASHDLWRGRAALATSTKHPPWNTSDLAAYSVSFTSGHTTSRNTAVVSSCQHRMDSSA